MQTQNLAELLAIQNAQFPESRIGMIDQTHAYGDFFRRAATSAGVLFETTRLRPGCRAAVIGANSVAYLMSWAALQLIGVETALINPLFPPKLTDEILSDLSPDAVVWTDARPMSERDVGVENGYLDIDASQVHSGLLVVDNSPVHFSDSQSIEHTSNLPGFGRAPGDIAGYMHTSGTSGRPKLCAQSHAYFLRLGRFVADRMALTDRDTVFAPLPLFHVNPLGYGIIGGLQAGSNVLSASRFSASTFWSNVVESRVTALVLHAPPIEILKRTTSPDQSAGHVVRVCFFADSQFLDTFHIPLGLSGYGSTEAGGLTHLETWRRRDPVEAEEGMSRVCGAPRTDVEVRLESDGELRLRAIRPHVLFEGYRIGSQLLQPFDDQGWFSTGDIARLDDRGSLVFIERRSESIRVKGEYVPIAFVEGHFGKMAGIDDVAVWREASDLVDDLVILYVRGDPLDHGRLVSASLELPRFMRPARVIRLREIPRDEGVGKVRRRELPLADELERLDLSES